MTTQQLPNYHALDEAVEEHPQIRNAFVLLGAVLVGIIMAVRWAWHFSPMTGL